MKLAFCDYIMSIVRTAVYEDCHHAESTLLKSVGPIQMDLHPTEGYFMSPKKTVFVQDVNGKSYQITVEEV